MAGWTWPDHNPFSLDTVEQDSFNVCLNQNTEIWMGSIVEFGMNISMCDLSVLESAIA